MTSADYTSHGAVAVIRLDNPPVNALSASVRKGIAEGLDRAADTDSVAAVILTGAGPNFCGGADVTEFNTPLMLAAPDLHDLFDLIEAFPKPVIAALNGVALGGGLELAMSCHYRVALASAMLGLPEVKLGLLPGIGGTQRLPRLVGAERALNMMLGGNPVAARELAKTALLDRVVDDDVLTGAIALAQEAAGGKLPLKKARDISVVLPNAEAFFDFARGAVAPQAKHYPAPAKIIDAVEAAGLQPFDQRIEVEAAGF